MKNEIIIYQNNDLATRLEIQLKDDTLWLTQQQIVDLFESSKANISEHITHIFDSGELNEQATVRKFRIVQKEGNRQVNRQIFHYTLDVVISVGYRVNSKRGTQFRIWANTILKDHLLKGYSLNNRMNRIEENLHQLADKVASIDVQINSDKKPTQGIFYDGQVFDAYVFVADIIKQAKKDIVLVDNYVDETTLQLFTKRNKNTSCTIYTKKISKVLQQDIEKHNSQYPAIKLKTFKKAHNRFLIIVKKTVYHIGASLKDVGKKWFAFSKMELSATEIITKLEQNR